MHWSKRLAHGLLASGLIVSLFMSTAVPAEEPGPEELDKLAAQIADLHHQGRYAEAIPMAARIVALADVYDALRAKRSYKPAFSHAHTRNIILEGDERLDPAGHFDPKLLAVFDEHHGELDEVWRAFHA